LEAKKKKRKNERQTSAAALFKVYFNYFYSGIRPMERARSDLILGGKEEQTSPLTKKY